MFSDKKQGIILHFLLFSYNVGMNEEQIKHLLTFMDNDNFIVWHNFGGNWQQLTGLNMKTHDEYRAYLSKVTGKYIDLYNVDIDDICVTCKNLANWPIECL